MGTIWKFCSTVWRKGNWISRQCSWAWALLSHRIWGPESRILLAISWSIGTTPRGVLYPDCRLTDTPSKPTRWLGPTRMTRLNWLPSRSRYAWAATWPEYLWPAWGTITAFNFPSIWGGLTRDKYPAMLLARASWDPGYHVPARTEGRTSLRPLCSPAA